jgi:hypothetical protein
MAGYLRMGRPSFEEAAARIPFLYFAILFSLRFSVEMRSSFVLLSP